MNPMRIRRDKLLKKARGLGAEAVLLTALPSLRYVTGFTGSNGAYLITGDSDSFITDFRYKEQVGMEVSGCEFHITSSPPLQFIIDNKITPLSTKIAFEDNRLSYLDYQRLSAFFPKNNLIPLHGAVTDIQQAKDTEEIAKVERAAFITDEVFSHIRGIIKPGILELDIAAEISYQIRKKGGEKEGFDSIIAGGARSAMPHAKTTSRAIQSNELVIMDFGAVYEGYHADITRTLLIGEPNRRQREIYTAVLEAQKCAIEAARKGISASNLDAVARNIIKERGFGEFFGHGLGHGLGLEIHEAPRISPLNKGRMKKGNVITIEPGIYIPGLGGVRIEDDIVIENDGCRVLTNSPKDLIVEV